MNDGTRTRGHQGHNLELYQLSYVHHRRRPRPPGATGLRPVQPGPTAGI